MADNLLERIGIRIRDLRKQRGLTQEELSEKAGINYSYLGGIERGQRNPTITHFVKIAETLEVQLFELFINIDDCNPTETLDKQRNEISFLLNSFNKEELNFASKILKELPKLR